MMKQQRDVIDELFIRPVKKKKKKNTIPINKMFVTKQKGTLKLPKTLKQSLEDLTDPRNVNVRIKK